MTTLIGIHSGDGTPGVVLASDLNRTSSNWNAQGDIAYRQQFKGEGQKIHIDHNGDFAVSMSGTVDEPYLDFLHALMNGKIDVKKAMGKGSFDELAYLNLSRWEGRTPDPNNLNALLLATRYDNKTELYTCWPMGRMEQRPWTSIGSGSGFAVQAINKQISNRNLSIPQGITIVDAIDLSVKGIDAASQDIYTGGLDLVVIGTHGIQAHGELIKSDVHRAREKAIRRIEQTYK